VRRHRQPHHWHFRQLRRARLPARLDCGYDPPRPLEMAFLHEPPRRAADDAYAELGWRGV